MSEKLPKKKQYKVPCTWQLYGVMYIEAESAEEAKEIAEEEYLPDGEYVDSSFYIDEEMFEYFLVEDGNLGRSDEEVIE